MRIDFAAMVPGLAAGRWDMIDTGIFFTPARVKIMQMIPYEQQAISLSVTKADAAKVTKPEDLAGKTVGVEIGGFEEARAKDIAKDRAQRDRPHLRHLRRRLPGAGRRPGGRGGRHRRGGQGVRGMIFIEKIYINYINNIVSESF